MIVPVASAQTTVTVECGDIIESEFSENFQVDFYDITLEAGTQVTAMVAPLGDTLEVATGIVAPNDAVVARSVEGNGHLGLSTE